MSTVVSPTLNMTYDVALDYFNKHADPGLKKYARSLLRHPHHALVQSWGIHWHLRQITGKWADPIEEAGLMTPPMWGNSLDECMRQQHFVPIAK